MSFFGGNTSLGATSTPAKPGGIFSSFGSVAPVSAAPAFGSTVATSTAPAFGAAQPFGSAVPAFGSTAPNFSGFGTNTATTTAPTAFGGFGTGAPSSAPAAGGFGGFGTTSTTTTAPAFGGFGSGQPSAFGTGTGAFGTTGTGAFGSNFGKLPTTTVIPGFGGFGGVTNFMLGQPQLPPPQISTDEAFAQSILNVAIFGDERDTIVAKWNYLQAMWGIGKLFYSQSAPPVDITHQNHLCRFKAIGYSRLPGKDNKLGLVALNFNKPLNEVRVQQQQLIQCLNAAFGNKPQLLINIDSCKELEEKKSQYVIYVEEKSQLSPNDSKRVLATDIANYLNQVNIKQQLSNIGIIEILALVLPDEDQLKEYLENPPKGVDPRMWRQANLDNPDPTKFIPVPMIGFSDLKWRVKCQESETDTHILYMKKVEKDLAELRLRHATTTSRIMEHKRKLAELSHHVLKVIVKQECTRKIGLPLTSEEEALRAKLENMQAIFSAPTQFKGRLSELLSQMRMQRKQFNPSGGSEYTIDKQAEESMKSFLSMQQRAMETLADTVTKDLKALDIIMQGLPELKRV